MPSLAFAPQAHHHLVTPLAITHFTPSLPTHLSSLPQAYIWPRHDKPSMSLHQHIQPSTSTDIPVIDMADEPCQMMSKLAHACEHWGIFYVSNHGVPVDLLETAREKAMKLFSLPLSTKMQALRKEGSFEGFGKAMIGKFFDRLMWSEGFTMMGYPSNSIAETTGKICPDGLNEYREVFEEYEKAMRGLGCQLMRAILEGMGTDMGEFGEMQYDVEREGSTALQLNYYPPCPEPDMAMGLPAHTDSTCLTILQQDVPGLEMQQDSCWSPVPPLGPALLVVHVGDMLQVLSNGKYKSIIHRAIPNKTKPRLSMVCLCFPPIDATITPVKEAVRLSQSQRLYRPFTWKDYMQAKSNHFMEALDHFKNTC